jgi:dTDP-4-dehydrorhamnose reductase
MKRILICGSNGLLGQRLALMLGGRTDYEVLNTSHHRSFVFDDRLFDYTQLDLTRKGDVKSLISSFQPDVIMNAAAMTNVDWCEDHREEAWNVNVVGVENLVEAARKVGARIIHISTDYVFDGKMGNYNEEDQPNPVNYYGKTKLAGENAIRIADIDHAILRTIVVYGNGINVKKNFALWVIESLKAGRHIRCVTDQVGNPTHVSDLAFAMIQIAELGKSGIFHVCGKDTVSRYEFAVKISEIFGFEGGMIEPILTREFVQRAVRPLRTSFVTLKAETEFGFKPMTIIQGIDQLRHELQTARKN